MLAIVSYIPLIIIVIGVIGNTTSFLIFTLSKEMNKFNCMVFLSFIAVTDTIGLFIWNLNHFLLPNYDLSIEYLNLFSCKFFVYIQYVSLQCSGFLYSMVAIDRFFTILRKPGSRLNRLPFGTRKSALVWSLGIVVFVLILNGHLLIFNGYYVQTADNKTELVCYDSLYYRLSPLWDYVQIILYTFIPFIIMCIFNSLLLKYVLCKLRRRAVNSNRDNRKTRLTISLIVLTFSFCFMTAPGTIGYGFFSAELLSTDHGHSVLIGLDSAMFFQQTMLFIISFTTNKKFAEIVKRNLKSLLYIRIQCVRTNKTTTTTQTINKSQSNSKDSHWNYVL